MNVAVSVIIPSYKPQAYLYECLDSLCCQTLPKECFEVILVLNGCKEPYLEQINKYASCHNNLPLHVIQIDLGGVSNARNIAISKSRGDYITFIDDDDYVSPSFLEELLAVSDEHTVGLCYPYAFNDGEEGGQLPSKVTLEYEKKSIHGKQKSVKVRRFFSGPWAKMFHRSIIGDRRFDTRFSVGEDSQFMYLISDRIPMVAFTSRNAIYYRRFRNESATTSRYSFTKVLKNCWLRFKINTSIYFSSLSTRSFRRYLYSVMGLCSILLNRMIRGSITNNR